MKLLIVFNLIKIETKYVCFDYKNLRWTCYACDIQVELFNSDIIDYDYNVTFNYVITFK
jgi:hypothetical protein